MLLRAFLPGLMCVSSITAQIVCDYDCTNTKPVREELLPGFRGEIDPSYKGLPQDIRDEMKPSFTFNIGDTGVMERADLTGAQPPPPEILRLEALSQHKATKARPLEDLEPMPLPFAFDWLTQGVSTVKCQWRRDCWAFASAAVMESSLMRQGRTNVNLSEQCILDCSGGGNANGGWWAPVFSYFRTTPIADEANYPYRHSQGKCRGVTASGPMVEDWDFVASDGGDSSAQELKLALYEHGPLIAGIRATNLFRAYRSGVFNQFPYYSGKIDHAVVIIGWNDYIGAWLIKNSWGTNCWGQSGLGWVKYDTNRIGYGAAWVLMK